MVQKAAALREKIGTWADLDSKPLVFKSSFRTLKPQPFILREATQRLLKTKSLQTVKQNVQIVRKYGWCAA